MMRLYGLILAVFLALAPRMANAQQNFPTLRANGTPASGGIPGQVVECAGIASTQIARLAAPCGTSDTPLYTSVSPLAGSAQVFTGSTITASNSYQQIAASCAHGGVIENSSGVSGSLFYVDWTGGIVAAATSLTNGATSVGPALAANQSGGKQMIPPTSKPVFVFGPSGATYRGSCW